jgi:epoxyqueuosine reductase QueG
MMERHLKSEIRSRCLRSGIPLLGFASTEAWHDPPFQPWMPEEFFPDSILPGARSVIVMGMPITLPVLESSPSIHYHELYRTVNHFLDREGYLLSGFLNERGHQSMWIPRDGYGSMDELREDPTAFFSHRHAALLAGMGTFGVNNMLLTPEYGPRVRLVSVVTKASIPPDPMIEEELCTRCMRCVDRCPMSALEAKDYPSSTTKKDRCTEWSDRLRKVSKSPCGICIKVCPVGEDRRHFDRLDPSIYEDGKDPVMDGAWEHVRSFGGRRQVPP